MIKLRVRPLFVATVAASGIMAAGAIHAASAPGSFRSYGDTQIIYYDVSGENPREVSEAIKQFGPVDPHTGKRFGAQTRYRFDWRSGVGAARCDAIVTLSTSVIFPRLRHRAKLSSAERARWDRYRRALEDHEIGHLELAYDALPKVKRAISSGSCQNAGKRAQKVLAELEEDQAAFDVRTEHGARTGASYP